ncbi:MAG: hypothetical protein KDD69_04180 [Bdellovibrionales bacterium]|nr:hypothetical protein [Bdellovibrionales bacterium]
MNKVLALAGRDEARDFIDIMYIEAEILPLGPLCWAAVGKDPGFTPLSLLELLKRRGKYQRADFDRLMLTEPVDLIQLKTKWLHSLELAEEFIRTSPPSEIGCLYYSASQASFVSPQSPGIQDAVPHYGQPGGVLPRFST